MGGEWVMVGVFCLSLKNGCLGVGGEGFGVPDSLLLLGEREEGDA